MKLEEEMIELKHDTLRFSFPEVHREARLDVHFQRTLRIPDDGKTYPLPPGLGRFPLRHVDDFREGVSERWLRRGGVFLPMYQSEALWICFDSAYPFAVKVAAGKINAVTGEEWNDGICQDPQDYMPVPDQPWLDGFCVEKGVIRQFVAMPLGAGYTAEEQITGEAEHGGIQFVAYPLRGELYRPPRLTSDVMEAEICFSLADAIPSMDMGLAPGGKMKQEIYEDRRKLSDWDTAHGSRCFVHLANSLAWRVVTGENPPTTPFTAKEYARHGMPWFEYYGGDMEALAGAGPLTKLKSVFEMGKEKGDVPLPENESVEPGPIVELGGKANPDQVREGTF